MSSLTKLPKEHYPSDAFDRFTSERDFDLGTAKAMAWMSQLAYETDEPEKISDILALWGLQPVEIVSREIATVLPQASTHAFVGAGRGATIIAFAGTDPLLLANWVTNFDCRIAGAGTAIGYDTAAMAVWPELKELVRSRGEGDGKVYVTGHSLGGALAALTAYRINAEPIADVDGVYTFGMPRAGTQVFVDAFNARLGERTYRFVYGDDLVPTVAPSSFGFRHVGRYLHCDRGDKFDVARLDPNTDCDKPEFVDGVTKELTSLLHGPLSSILSAAGRLKLAVALASARGPAGMRTDPAGIAIELLPARLRDHMPDRYIGGL